MGGAVSVVRDAFVFTVAFLFCIGAAYGQTQRFCGFASKVSVSKIRCSNKRVGKLNQLKSFPNLRELNFTRSGLKNFNGLPQIGSLRVLSLNYTRVRSLRGLASVSMLEELDASNTALKSLKGIEHLTEIRNLTLWNLEVNDIGPLASLSKLESLVLGGSQVSDLRPLEQAPSLRLINLEQTAIRSLAPLKRALKLEKVFLSGVPITKEELDDFRRERPKVQIIGCTGSGVTPCRVIPVTQPKICAELLGCCAVIKKRSPMWRKRCESIESTLDNLAKKGGPHPGLMTQICEHSSREVRKDLGEKVPEACRGSN